MLNWQTPIDHIPGIGEAYAQRLTKLLLTTVGDLLTHIPVRYEDLSQITPIASITDKKVTTVLGTIASFKNAYTRNGKALQKATFHDGTGTIEIVWFNQPYLSQTLKNGTPVALSGLIEREGYQLVMRSPEYEMIYPNRPLLHMGRLVPVYPLTAGVSGKWLRAKMANALTKIDNSIEYLPQEMRTEQALPPLFDALRNIHFPKSMEDADEARNRLAFDELLLMQLSATMRRARWAQKEKTISLPIAQTQLAHFIAKLPFALTRTQEKALNEIVSDLSREVPMNRLLQGDVGSGKTVIAAAAAYIAALHKKQTIIMAPTEILAQQHFETFSKFFAPHNISVALKTGSHKKNDDRNIYIWVGTQALIQKTVAFDDVGLVIMDEQHRFGVAQRGALRAKGQTPHTLTMTATPIPRTIMLTAYGDLALSQLTQLPSGRLPIKTRVVSHQKRGAAYSWIKDKLTESTPHRQAFIVVPFIDPSETMKSVKAANAELEILQKKIFPTLKIGLLHGRLKSKEKDRILAEFRDRKYDILLCTPVVEVGIDIPNATIMVIEAGERYGLAQLHQLRGRVGRSDLQSYCLLFTSEDSPETTKRLQALESSNDGAALSELDLRIRGPGSIFSTQQHGQLYFKTARYEDMQKLDAIGAVAKKLLEASSDLSKYPDLKERVKLDTIEAIAPD